MRKMTAAVRRVLLRDAAGRQLAGPRARAVAADYVHLDAVFFRTDCAVAVRTAAIRRVFGAPRRPRGPTVPVLLCAGTQLGGRHDLAPGALGAVAAGV